MECIAADHCRNLVRQHDRDRYLSALFAAEEHRDALLALYAFDVEINRIPDIVSDPMPGEIRLQWWSDALQNIAHGSVEANPVAASLVQAIETYRLPTTPLLDLIEAHTFDLYNDPMPMLTDLEGYAGETVSAIMQLSAIILAGGRDPGTADVSGHAGAALGIVETLRRLPWHTAKRQVFLPADVLGRHGMSSEEVLEPVCSSRLHAVVQEMCAHARHHLDRFEQAFVAAGCQGLAAAYLQTGIAPAYLKVFECGRKDPRKDLVEIPQWRRQWTLWRTARRLASLET